MPKLIQYFFVILLFIPSFVNADAFNVPNTQPRERLSYSSKVIQKSVASDLQSSTLAQRALRGEMPTRIDVEIERKTIGGSKIVTFTRNEQLTNGNRAVWEFALDASNKLILKTMKKKITTKEGVTVRDEFVNFRAPTLNYPDDLMQVYVLEYALRGLDFKHGYANSFPLYFTSINIINMDIKVVGQEDVQTPAGKFKCWKVEMTPHLEDWVGKIAANLLRAFTPNYLFWFGVEEGHPLIKYQGILGAIGAPVQTQELIARSKPAETD